MWLIGEWHSLKQSSQIKKHVIAKNLKIDEDQAAHVWWTEYPQRDTRVTL